MRYAAATLGGIGLDRDSVLRGEASKSTAGVEELTLVVPTGFDCATGGTARLGGASLTCSSAWFGCRGFGLLVIV